MISFSCPVCQLKLKVDDKFAGRPAKCLTCKQPLIVPQPSATVAYVPPPHIEGEASSLAKIGHEGGVTLDHDPAGRKPTAPPGQKPQRSVGEALAGRKQASERYVIEGEIARGGMGAVLRAVDCDLRREVAVKQLLDEKDPTKKARFIEEAQINAQLEHPNIVPVHDLRIDAQGRPYLIMKLVKGQSLKDVLDQLRDHPKQAEKEWTLGRLLNVLVNVCNGLASAHGRGVIHRDLKPANIMLGDYGAVYVMDWGLAKVLRDSASGVASAPRASPAELGALTQPRSPARPSKVVISREPEADLTQEGAIVGTPLYMPPEQASGQPVDQRSDVYSLGAILYEMLTLQAPIDKEGGYLAILLRVTEGQIVPPEQRETKRAKAGKIPKELAAIAMKALAKEPWQRYPNVESLRKDIERFQEGRSVSAKEDTKREMIWKFVKRNKGFSTGVAVALVVLLGSLWVLGNAWWETSKAHAALRKQTEAAVPALVRAGRLAANERQFDDALKQAELALTYAPGQPDALLLRAQILIVRQEFPEAVEQLEQYLKQRPGDQDAKELLELCRKGKADDIPSLLAISRVFHEQQAYSLVDGLLSKYGKNSQEARTQILQMYREIIEKTWPGKGQLLNIDGTGLHLNLAIQKDLVDLSPLKGMPLTTLTLHGNRQVRDLTPLKGMPLTTLTVSVTQVIDLTPLKGMALTKLKLGDGYGGCPVSDLSPLKGMPLNTLDLHSCRQVKDLTPLKGMKLKVLLIAETSIKDLTPLQGMELEDIRLSPRNFTDGLDMLRQMTSLKIIGISFDRHPGSWSAKEFWQRYDKGEFK